MERAEKIGLGVATAGHVLLFGLLSAGFLATPNPLKLNSPPMDVSLVDEVDLKSMGPQISTLPPPPSVAPEQGPTEDAAPAPTPEPAPEPEPTPAPPPPKPAPAKPAVPKPAPKPRTAPEKPAPKPKPAPPRPAAAAPAAPPKKAQAKPKTAAPARASGQGKADKPKGSLLGKDFLKGIDADADAPRTPAPPPAAVLGPAQKAALNAEISRQLKPYWRAPSGADADKLVTILRWRLNRDGTLADGPTVVDQTGVTDSNRPQATVHRENAIKAVRSAAPFRLPPEYYDTWKNIVSFKFDRRL